MTPHKPKTPPRPSKLQQLRNELTDLIKSFGPYSIRCDATKKKIERELRKADRSRQADLPWSTPCLWIAAALAPMLTAAALTFAWDVNTDTVTTQYRLYQTTGGITNLVSTVIHPANSATIADPPRGTTNTYVVRAADAAGIESDDSNQVTNIRPPRAIPPKNFHRN
jgi:hypothetical protein